MGRLAQLVCAVGLFHHAVGWAPVAPMRAVRPATPMRRAVPLISTLSDGGRGDREPRLKAALMQLQGRLKQARVSDLDARNGRKHCRTRGASGRTLQQRCVRLFALC